MHVLFQVACRLSLTCFLCGYWGHHAMAASSTSEKPWADRWRAACSSQDSKTLLALLQDASDEGKSGLGSLEASDLFEVARVACEKGHVGLLREVVRVIETRCLAIDDTYIELLEVACWEGHVDIVQELLHMEGVPLGVVVEAAGEGFLFACQEGHLDVLEVMLALSGDREVDVHAGFEGERGAGFRLACQNGHIDIVRKLLTLTGDREVDVHGANWQGPEAGFRWACACGHVDVVRLLLGLTGDRTVDVHAASEGEPESGFLEACSEGHAGVLRELLGLTGHQAIPLQTRLDAGQVAVQPAKDAVWAGTSTRRGRRGVVLLRSAHGGRAPR